MALWKHALAKLRGAAAGVEKDTAAVLVVAENGQVTSAEEVSAEVDDGNEPAQAEEFDKNALARELQSGIEVSIGDLESCGAGWRFRGHPVMIFGTDAPELEDPQRRREFFSRAHLFPCCGALESEQRSAWIGTDLVQLNESHGQGPFNLCRTCVEAVAGRGADPAVFDFASHVRSHGDSYFGVSACYWRPGENSQPLQPAVIEAEGSCPNCGCASKEAGWQLRTEDVRNLGQPERTCVLCAERSVEGCLHFEGEQLLEAARVRYRYLIGQAAKAPTPSWKLAEAILPLGWQPLLRSLQRILPPPELFFSYSETAEPAVLAWPALHRGIVETATNPEQSDATEWSLWTRAQIETELGFKLR